MAQTIDERIVEMRFDNKQFEAGSKQTMGTLTKLKEALKFPDVAKDFGDIQKASDRVDMNGLSSAIDGVKLKFSALEVAAITALSNIVNRAVDAGVRLAKSLSVDQVMGGFREYELKMNSVQTIMASTGESLETVNKYLEELNVYADKTIYSFSDMTQNIGKFTNAGVKLEDAVKAIQGVSNVAAVSGANANEASRAMYNFAQALSAGYVKLIDWKSIENANMATVEFKQALLDTALAMGTVVKVEGKYRTTTTDLNGKVSELFDSTSMFNDSLSAQWLTTDVLVQTLNNYSNDVRTMSEEEKKAYAEKLRSIGYTEEQIKSIESLGSKAFDSAQDVKTLTQLLDTMRESVGSGWAQTFELIFGDFEEAKKLWTAVNNTLGAALQESSDSRNELLRGWNEAGGRNALLEGISNSYKAFVSILKTIKKAFRDVFPKTTSDQLVKITNGFRDLTANLALSDESLEDLRSAFSGVFSVIKLGIDGFAKLLKAILPFKKPLLDTGKGFLSLAGSIGRTLTSFTESIRSSEKVKKAYDSLSSGISEITSRLSNGIKKIKEFGVSILGLSGTKKLIDTLRNAFQNLSSKVWDALEKIVGKIKGFVDSLFDLDKIDVDKLLNDISSAFSNLASGLENFSLKSVGESFAWLGEKIKEFLKIPMSNEGFSTFVTNASQFGEDLKEAFTWDALMDRLEKIMEVFGKFYNWIKGIASKIFGAFEDVDAGTVFAAGGASVLIYSIVKMSETIEGVSKSLSNVTGIFGSVKSTLSAYQKDLKADALLKVAGAIAILAGALVLLSFADSKRLMEAATALALVSGVLIFGISRLLEAVNKGKELNNVAVIFAKGLSSSLKKIGEAIQIKALGGAVKKFAESIAIIAVSIIALGIMYKKDKTALMAGVELVKMIGLALVGIMTIMSIAGAVLKGGMKGFSQAASGVLALSLSLGLILSALNKLFKMEFPPDWRSKMDILEELLIDLGLLALVVGVASRLAGKGNKVSAGPFLGLAAMLMVTIVALNKLFKMEFPPDWEARIGVLNGIFIALGALMLVIGAASRLAGGNIKATGTILAMCLFIGTVVAALMVLSFIPYDKLLVGAGALGIILIGLATALSGAGTITNDNTNKTVLAMAIAVGVIAASLSLLAMVPLQKLAKATVSLGSVLLALAINFKQVAKVTNKNAWSVIIAMVAATMGIAYSLYVLAEQPWPNLLAGAAGLSAVLLSIAATLRAISKSSGIKKEKILLFLAATLSLVPIGIALYELSKQPWEGMLASAAAISAVLLSFAMTMQTISGLRGIKTEKILLFMSASLMLIPIGIALNELSTQPWDGLLAAGLALSSVLLAFSVSFQIISAAKPDLMAIGAFTAGAVGVGLIAFSLYQLAEQPWENLLASSLAISTVLIAMSAAMTICSGVGAVVPAALTGMGLLDLFIANFALVLVALGAIFQSEEAKGLLSGGADILIQIGEAIGGFVGSIVGGLLSGITSSLPQIAIDLSNFMNNLQPFIAGSKNMDSSSLESVKLLSGIIVGLTVAEIVNGIGKLFNLSLIDLAVELSAFMIALLPFIRYSNQIKEENMKACTYLGDMLLSITKSQVISGIARVFGLSGSLSDFGEELKGFGPSIAAFAEQVKDVKPEAVEGAAAAAEIMANMADKLPASDGLIQKIFGDKSLSDFGHQLVVFGPYIKSFAEQVKDVKPEAVEGAAAAAEIMANMADKLPTSDSLWNTIFGGGQVSLSEFGVELIKFAESMVGFSDSISGMNVWLVDGAITAFTKLIDLANYVQGTSAESLIAFSEDLSEISADSINNFIESFSNETPNAVASVTTFCSAVSTTLVSEGITIQARALTVGNNLVTGIQVGLMQTQPLLMADETALGANIPKWLSDAIVQNKDLPRFAISKLCSTVIEAFRNNLSQPIFRDIGANVSLGLKYGIESKINEVADAAIRAARSAVEAARRELDEHSPSKVAGEIGGFFSLGIAKGIVDRIKAIALAGTKAADEAIEPVKTAVDGITSIIDSGNFDIDPVIRPVVDLTDVQQGAKDISDLMNRKYDLSSIYDKALDTSASFSKTKKRKLEDEQPTKTDNGNKYEFVQYNYSPKSLSRSEIYRQTNNQFSAFKRTVNST